LYVARKERRPDEWDPPIEPYDPYGPGEAEVIVSTDTGVSTDARQT
jgi:hypothetical protein